MKNQVSEKKMQESKLFSATSTVREKKISLVTLKSLLTLKCL